MPRRSGRTLTRFLALAFVVSSSASANAPEEAAGFASDARAIESLINDQYAYLERLPNVRFALTDTLKAEADAVDTRRELVRFAERAVALLADHHAITGASLADSWAVFPTYGDLWIERRGTIFVIEAVRGNSPAARAGILPGDRLVAINGQATGRAVTDYWADLGSTGGPDRDGHAARVLAAGQRNRTRRLTIGRGRERPRQIELPSLYAQPDQDRAPVTTRQENDALVVAFNDSLGNAATVSAFDAAMAEVSPGQTVILDLTETPSGGNTTIARAILGWFVTAPTFYQMHRLPAEERRTGIARQWAEQVLPREGRQHTGPVTVRVGRWTGSMGEGLAIGFAAIGARVEGDRMAGLLGAIYDHRLPASGLVIKLPTERLMTVGGLPREAFVPQSPGNR